MELCLSLVSEDDNDVRADGRDDAAHRWVELGDNLDNLWVYGTHMNDGKRMNLRDCVRVYT